jgi:hypothetical protein
MKNRNTYALGVVCTYVSQGYKQHSLLPIFNVVCKPGLKVLTELLLITPVSKKTMLPH